MDYPVELLLTRADCTAVLNDTNEDIARVEFNITALTRSTTLRTNAATADASEITSLTDQITPLETRVAGMAPGEARTIEELRLRSLRREREELQDEQIGKGSRAAFRRRRDLDAAQRQLTGFEDCLAQVTVRRDALPA
ncbi:MAG: hypothetical protein H7Z21_19070 [Hymenobacter sp.]|nr:hypothetical protein [Hymenobacter sp.]